jgi:hypothetical protein
MYRLCMVCAAALMWSVVPAKAQGLLDNGLPSEAPAVIQYYLGPFAISPNIAIRELGIDTNVFDEPTNPKRDYVVSLAPTINAFGQLGLVRVVINSGTEFTWYARYTNERALGRQLKGRIDFVPSRVRLSVGGGLVQTRERPDLEIELRARRSDRELWGGAAFQVSPMARLYTSVHQRVVDFQDNEVYRGTLLSVALNRQANTFEGGIAIDVTPFTTLLVAGRRSQDRFEFDSRRDSDSNYAMAELAFSADAIIQGRANIGFRDFQPIDPTVERYRGLTSRAGLSFTGFWRGRMDFDASRDVSYSYDFDEGYYVGSSVVATYTQRIVGALDVLARVGAGTMDYGRRAGLEPKVEDLRTLAGGVGYNFNSGARFGVTYEYEVRESDADIDRRYISRRLYASYTYAIQR